MTDEEYLTRCKRSALQWLDNGPPHVALANLLLDLQQRRMTQRVFMLQDMLGAMPVDREAAVAIINVVCAVRELEENGEAQA